MAKTELSVYNLQFPDYIHSLNIGGYKFRRIKDYEKAFYGLQHRIESYGSEFPIKPNTGTHQLTAIVDLPEKEKPPILEWVASQKFTHLQDVLLFLSLFTGRNVFALNKKDQSYPLRPDPRGHFWGGQFRLSKYTDAKWRHKETGNLLEDAEMENKPVYDYERLGLGLERTVNVVLDTIASRAWQTEYKTGYFIFIFRQAMRQEDIEPAFLLCWTIWEHLFTLHNPQLKDAEIVKTSGADKISFILAKYLLIKLNTAAKEEIKRIARARNRIIHFGMIPQNVDIAEMTMFIRLTEQIMAIILNLEPSNAFNSFERLQEFLKGRKGVSAL